MELYDSGVVLQGFGKTPAPVASAAIYDYEAVIPAYVRFIPDDQDQSTDYRIVVATWHRHPTYRWTLVVFLFCLGGTSTQMPASRETEEQSLPNSLAVSREFVVVTGDLKKLFCYDHTGKLVATVLSESRPAQPAFSRDERQLIVGQAVTAPSLKLTCMTSRWGSSD